METNQNVNQNNRPITAQADTIEENVINNLETLEELPEDIPEETPEALTEEIKDQAQNDILPKMKPLSMQLSQSFYNYRFFGLFINVAWISGFLQKNPSEPNTVILANNTLSDTNIRISVPSKVNLKTFNEPVSLTCRLVARKVVNPITGEHEDTLDPHVIYSRAASVIDMPLNDNFNKLAAEKIQSSDAVKKEYEEWLKKANEVGAHNYHNKMRSRANDGSMVMLTGVVDSLHYRGKIEGGNGVAPKRARLKIMLRQTESDKILLPVHFYGPLSHQFYRLLNRGNLLRIVGRIGANVRPIMKDGVRVGSFTTHYVECLQPPMQAHKDDVKLYPQWFILMRNELLKNNILRQEERNRVREEKRRKKDDFDSDDFGDDDDDDEDIADDEITLETDD